MRTLFAIVMSLVCVLCWLAAPMGLIHLKSDPFYAMVAVYNAGMTTWMAFEAWAWARRAY